MITRLNTVAMPMNTWNLHLGNIQKAARSHKWNQAETTTPPNDDLVRLPANSKSRFSLTEEQAPATQHKYCTSFLASIGPNHDLVTRPRSSLQTSKNEQYVVPDEQLPIIPQHDGTKHSQTGWSRFYTWCIGCPAKLRITYVDNVFAHSFWICPDCDNKILSL